MSSRKRKKLIKFGSLVAMAAGVYMVASGKSSKAIASTVAAVGAAIYVSDYELDIDVDLG